VIDTFTRDTVSAVIVIDRGEQPFRRELRLLGA